MFTVYAAFILYVFTKKLALMFSVIELKDNLSSVYLTICLLCSCCYSIVVAERVHSYRFLCYVLYFLNSCNCYC